MPEVLTVTYERKLSDGNYGSEGLSLSISIQLKESESAEETLTDDITLSTLFDKVRNAVLTELSHSEAPRVAAVALAELTGKGGRAWAMSNAATEEHNIRAMEDEDGLESLPF